MKLRNMTLRNNVSLLILSTVLISGCTSIKTEELSLSEQTSILEKDFENLFPELKEVSEPISLHTAIARAIKYNLDYKVTLLEEEIQNKKFVLEQYHALPNPELSAGITRRSNKRASSSRSVNSGLQSLESSYSSDRSVRSAALQTNWDLIDSGLTLSRAQNTSDEAKIAFERRRKMLQTIAREAHVLYWKASSAQLLSEQIKDLLEHARENLGRLKQAEDQGIVPKDKSLHQQLQLYKSINELMKANEEMASARYELASLINVSPSANFVLDVVESDFFQDVPVIQTRSENLADIALIYRPESREEILKNRVTERAKVQEILSSIPGLDIFVSGQYDSNSFLLNSSWMEIGTTISQSLLDLLTLPQRLDNVETEIKLAEIRRKALLSAIVTQTYIAHNSYGLSKDMYAAQKKLHELESAIYMGAQSKFQVEALSDTEFTEIKIDTLLGKINFYNSFVDMWHDYIMLIDTLGLDPVPYDSIDGISLASLESIIKYRHNNMNNAHLTKIASIIHDYSTQEVVDSDQGMDKNIFNIDSENVNDDSIEP